MNEVEEALTVVLLLMIQTIEPMTFTS